MTITAAFPSAGSAMALMTVATAQTRETAVSFSVQSVSKNVFLLKMFLLTAFYSCSLKPHITAATHLILNTCVCVCLSRAKAVL